MHDSTNRVAAIMRHLWRLPSRMLIVAVRCYQFVLSPLIGRDCRFQPTCSNYFIGAVEHYGAICGTWRGMMRICRCHPWHPGGY
ncbi:MAG: membrane protein insertion efficiency factor YidD, partial [Planctomycetota bacterium]|nr:membrane protein insertion efficiency factor YidD [Planctomycetota bacterium]